MVVLTVDEKEKFLSNLELTESGSTITIKPISIQLEVLFCPKHLIEILFVIVETNAPEVFHYNFAKDYSRNFGVWVLMKVDACHL